MTQEEQVFIANVMVTNLTRETMASNVISWPTNVDAKFNPIGKIHKYRGFHEGHHFIPMVMEVHNTFEHDMDCFIRECVRLFHNKWSRSYLSLYFCIYFFRQHVSITLQGALAYAIERKIALVGDVCSRLPITIRSHNLHVGDIRRVVGEIVSYNEKD
jgi:hypothetical protein